MVPKLRSPNTPNDAHHRSGWGYALRSLAPLYCPTGGGILLDSKLEASFATEAEAKLQRGILPYRVPWIGVCHVPPEVPDWSEPWKCPTNYMGTPLWRESLPTCRGIITLSRYLRDWVAERVDVPVLALKHPTEIPALRFSFDAYLRNERPRVIHVGWWLRKFSSIERLPVHPSRKAILLPHDRPNLGRVLRVIDAERGAHGLPPLEEWKTARIARLDNDGYDRLLSDNVVFADLHAASVNNMVIECIARATPILVNPLPAVVEYLGEAYPFYFHSLEEAAAKAENPDCVHAAHEYLKRLSLSDLSGESFLRGLAESELYREL